MSVRTIASGADFGTNTFVFAVQITGLPSGSTQIPIFYCGNGGTGIGSNNTYLDLPMEQIWEQAPWGSMCMEMTALTQVVAGRHKFRQLI